MSKRKVYVLGAGFSKNFGLPLADELLALLVKESNNGYFVNRINVACRNFYPSFRDAFANYPNVEDFYNYYYSLMNYYSLWSSGPNKFVRNFVPEFVFEVSKYIDRKAKNICNNKEFYIEKFCKGLNLSDIIITFNWDNILEKYLEKYRIPYSFQLLPDLKKVTLLKLHGSIDWIKVDKSIKNSKSYKPVVYFEEKGKKEFILKKLHNDPIEQIKSDGEQPYIIPPLAYKDELVKPLGALWGQAYTALRDSKHKVYIGYSLPREDTLARVLISSYRIFAAIDQDEFLQDEKVTVINPDEKMEVHYKKYCTNNIIFWNVSYSRFVDVAIEKQNLLAKLLPYKNILLECSNKFIQEIVKRIFDKRTYPIDLLEKKRIKEYLKENYQIEMDI